jgi:hypothetical protein
MDVSLVLVGLTVNPPPCAAQQRAANCSGMPGSVSPLAYLACPPNASLQLLPEAGATQERRLEAVSCKALFGWARPCACLSDHLVRLKQERRGDGEAQFLRGLEVDDQLELRGLLHRQVGGFGSLQDAVHVVGGAAK